MVLEQIVSIEWLRRRPLYAIFLGLTYTFIAAITGYLFFKDKFSVSLLFLVTLLLVPSLINLLSFEEEKERSDGVKRFFQNHRSIFEIYLFLSVGVFIAYILVIFFLGASGLGLSTTVGEQMKVLGGEITIEQIKNFEANHLVHSLNLFVNNLGVAVIFFLLSFFYGAGAIFLMVWNASIFATFVSLTIKDGEVGESDLANNSVVSSKIKDGTIGTDDLADSAVTSAKIKDGIVSSDDISDGTI
ncbi:hypothetical protein HYT52_01275, partial [Candidatus Woesearchaeota archaeon]|nr:hypothetical protein [Candidatus Woesearchaeota archaeon]